MGLERIHGQLAGCMAAIRARLKGNIDVSLMERSVIKYSGGVFGYDDYPFLIPHPLAKDVDRFGSSLKNPKLVMRERKNYAKPLAVLEEIGVQIREDDGTFKMIARGAATRSRAVPDSEEKIVGEVVFYRGTDIKRKLALARAIIHHPEVLFLDEPSAGLDPEAQKMVRDLILQLSEEERITIFLNSHDLDEVQRICSKIAILQRGEIKAYDTIDNLRGKFTKPVVEITLPNNGEVGKALELVSALDYVSDCNRHNDGITVTLDESVRSATLLSFLVEKGVKVEEIKRVSKSLEDVYLEIVRREERNA